MSMIHHEPRSTAIGRMSAAILLGSVMGATPVMGSTSTTAAPSGSPTRIAFADTRDDADQTCGLGYACAQIYSMAPDGTDQRRLTVDNGDDEAPHWSADGTQLAFQHADKTPKHCPNGTKVCSYDIYAMNADGTGLKNLTRSGRASDEQPVWSPDGAMLAFASDRDDPNLRRCTRHLSCHFDIYTIDADGTDLTRITTDGDSHAPSWSPDGSRIAFHRGHDVWVMNPHGSHRIRLTDVAGYVFDNVPDWSPDGTSIAFAQVDVESFLSSVWTMDPDGSHQRELTVPGMGFQPGDTSPAWAPDGSRLVDSHADDRGFTSIAKLRPDGSRLRVIPNTATAFEPDWQPRSSSG